MSKDERERRSLEVGDRLWAVRRGSMVDTRPCTVERVTPTGIMVLDTGVRLSPTTAGDPHEQRYSPRGADQWTTTSYYPDAHPMMVTILARRALRTSVRQVGVAMDMCRNDPEDSDAATALRDAAASHRSKVEQFHGGSGERALLAHTYARANDIDWEPAPTPMEVMPGPSPDDDAD